MVKVGAYEVLEGLYYSKDFEWIKVEGGEARRLHRGQPLDALAVAAGRAQALERQGEAGPLDVVLEAAAGGTAHRVTSTARACHSWARMPMARASLDIPEFFPRAASRTYFESLP